jgi:hypothetical protein
MVIFLLGATYLAVVNCVMVYAVGMYLGRYLVKFVGCEMIFL